MELNNAEKLDILEKQNVLSKADKDMEFEFKMKTFASKNKKLAQQLAHGEQTKRGI